MECDPALNEEVLYVAMPEAFNVPIPSVVDPSRKVTEPVGTVAFPDGPVTVAVKVTDCPLVDGLSDEAIVVVDAAVVPWMPVPCMYTGCGLPVALSVTSMVPVSGKPTNAVFVGLNCTFAVQLDPDTSIPEHVELCRMKSCEVLIALPGNVMFESPVLVRVTVRGALVVFSF